MGGRNPTALNKVIAEFDVLRAIVTKEAGDDAGQRAAMIAGLNIAQAFVTSTMRIADMVAPELPIASE